MIEIIQNTIGHYNTDGMPMSVEQVIAENEAMATEQMKVLQSLTFGSNQDLLMETQSLTESAMSSRVDNEALTHAIALLTSVDSDDEEDVDINEIMMQANIPTNRVVQIAEATVLEKDILTALKHAIFSDNSEIDEDNIDFMSLKIPCIVPAENGMEQRGTIQFEDVINYVKDSNAQSAVITGLFNSLNQSEENYYNNVEEALSNLITTSQLRNDGDLETCSSLIQTMAPILVKNGDNRLKKSLQALKLVGITPKSEVPDTLTADEGQSLYKTQDVAWDDANYTGSSPAQTVFKPIINKAGKILKGVGSFVWNVGFKLPFKLGSSLITKGIPGAAKAVKDTVNTVAEHVPNPLETTGFSLNKDFNALCFDDYVNQQQLLFDERSHAYSYYEFGSIDSISYQTPYARHTLSKSETTEPVSGGSDIGKPLTPLIDNKQVLMNYGVAAYATDPITHYYNILQQSNDDRLDSFLTYSQNLAENSNNVIAGLQDDLAKHSYGDVMRIALSHQRCDLLYMICYLYKMVKAIAGLPTGKGKPYTQWNPNPTQQEVYQWEIFESAWRSLKLPENLVWFVQKKTGRSFDIAYTPSTWFTYVINEGFSNEATLNVSSIFDEIWKYTWYLPFEIGDSNFNNNLNNVGVLKTITNRSFPGEKAWAPILSYFTLGPDSQSSSIIGDILAYFPIIAEQENDFSINSLKNKIVNRIAGEIRNHYGQSWDWNSVIRCMLTALPFDFYSFIKRLSDLGMGWYPYTTNGSIAYGKWHVNNDKDAAATMSSYLKIATAVAITAVTIKTGIKLRSKALNKALSNQVILNNLNRMRSTIKDPEQLKLVNKSIRKLNRQQSLLTLVPGASKLLGIQSTGSSLTTNVLLTRQSSDIKKLINS